MFLSLRRYVAIFMLVALALPILAACGSAPATQLPSDKTTTEAPVEKATESVTETATVSATEMATPSVTETATMSAIEMATPSVTETATVSATEIATPSVTETATVSATEIATPSVTETTTVSATEMEAPSTMGAVVLPDVEPADVKGDIISAGSSTVYPLTERISEIFADDGYKGLITIDSIGSGAGFERFCVSAETDIANASRSINEKEVASCKEKGREPLEFRVGTDALAVVVSAKNDFLGGLTMEDLAKVYSTNAKTWADINPSWPAEKIQLFAPGTDSGTFDFFVEAVFDKDEKPILETDAQFSEDDNVLVQGVMGSPYAIGFFGYAYYNENKDMLKAIALDGIAPTEATAEDNTYPLSRPLFIYSAPSIIQEKPQVAAFINYYLTYVNDEILDVGYFPASEDALNASRQTLLDAMEVQ